MEFAAGAAAYLDVLRFVHTSSWVKCRESLRRAQFAHGQKSVQGLPLSGRFALAPFVWPCEVRVRISLRLRSRLERDRCSQLEPFWRVRVFFLRWRCMLRADVGSLTPFAGALPRPTLISRPSRLLLLFFIRSDMS